ncbi:MAG: 50S ribosomal protein L18Ae [Candidatus ainarchaeum sp.]|jgi:ribosomal protein L20A (L18A)|nr:50S ribosomal protein L18Ae [Candidatus ainarchaeum sp.]MDD4468082.1 50S ribosomal protein L18Ae [Candidatus ainarchaeum sp.]HPM85646.1 50S ribosomal protein L18Ae [archaeon]
MPKFVAKGIIQKRGEEQLFSRKFEARNEKAAKEKIYAEFGSKNNLKRRSIIISELKEVE